MNDSQIRTSFHKKCLYKYHCDSATLVVDELGLQHGKCRADIAVINGHLIGYEIKSDADSLRRLTDQIDSYNAVFDRASAIVAARHLSEAVAMLPQWWGVISVSEGRRGAIHFRTVRRPKRNVHVDEYAITQLLWRDEAQEILANLGVHGNRLREERANLYRCIVGKLDSCELRETVRQYLMKRTSWRHPARLSPGDGLSQPSAMS
jgi:hypothetical protein